MYNITFKFEQKGLEPITLSNIEGNQSILEVALKNDIKYYKLLPPLAKRIVIFQIIGATILLTLNWYTFIYAINNVSLKYHLLIKKSN